MFASFSKYLTAPTPYGVQT